MLNPTDARVFSVLVNFGGWWTARFVAAQIKRSPVVALRSLRRLTDAGLATEQRGQPAGFGTGGSPSLYTAVPGAKWPGVTPWGERGTRPDYQPVLPGAHVAPQPVLAPPVAHVPPQPVTVPPTLAGTVAQQMHRRTAK